MNFPELMFYAESEGFLPTRFGKINSIIKDIKNYPQPTIDEETFIEICNKYEIDYATLNQKELNYILSKIR